jgi:hypothetical protein
MEEQIIITGVDGTKLTPWHVSVVGDHLQAGETEGTLIDGTRWKLLK